MEKLDPSVDALKRLCQDVGGYKMLAIEVGVNDQTIYQIISGVKLPSGNPKGVGPTLRRKIEARYPDWLATSREGALSPAATKAAELAQAIEKVETVLEQIKASPASNTVHIEHAWPFDSIKREQWEAMTPAQKMAVESIIQTMLAPQHATGASASHSEKRQATG